LRERKGAQAGAQAGRGAEGEPRNGGGRGAWALNGTARVLSRPRGERCP